jgi:ABC-2 type transport system ATP-binding protein
VLFRSVEVQGVVPWRERTKHVSRIGVVFGQRTQLWWDVPVIDSFELLRDIYSIPDGEYRRSLDELGEVLSLGDILDTPLRQLSLGQRMRCELAGSLLHKPHLLFLDEPTIGLDAVSKLKVREFLKKYNKEHSTTIILTTHDMDDIEALCNRVMVLGHGRILFDGSVEALRQSYAPERRLVVEYDGEPPRGIERAESVAIDGQKATILFNPAAITTAEMIAKVTSDCAVRGLVVEHLPIEEIIARMYREVAI